MHCGAIHIKALKFDQMRVDHHQTVSCDIGDNDSNIQDFGDKFDVTGLLTGRNELD